jgi:hypothetical protein
MLNGTHTSVDDDQGDNEPKNSRQLNSVNGTTINGGTAPLCP